MPGRPQLFLLVGSIVLPRGWSANRASEMLPVRAVTFVTFERKDVEDSRCPLRCSPAKAGAQARESADSPSYAAATSASSAASVATIVPPPSTRSPS